MVQAWAYISPLLGLALLFFAFVFFQTGETEMGDRRRKQLVGLPTTRIADAPSSGVIEVVGTIVADPDAPPLLAPLSRRPVVWSHVTVESRYELDRDPRWIGTDQHHTEGKSFLLDDGSGARARIEVRGGIEVDLGADHVVVLEKEGEAPPAITDFLERADIARHHSAMRFHECVLREGETLVVVGHARRERALSADDYRGQEATRLVIASGGSDDQNELYLTRRTEKEQVATAREGVPLGIALLVLGLVVLGTGGWCIYLLAR